MDKTFARLCMDPPWVWTRRPVTATGGDVSSAISPRESGGLRRDVVQGCDAMPNVVDVLDHWIELYSADPEVTATAD
jgi:hypothetical protein